MRPLAFALALVLACAAARAGDPPDARNPSLVEVLRRSAPAAVSIVGANPNPNGTVTHYAGSGSLIHPAGYVLTNAHVVGSGHLAAHLAGGEAHRCRVVARHPSEDLAVLKLDRPRPFPVLPLGRNDRTELGETAIVIGNPNGLQHTVSTGIVSRLPPGYVNAGHIQTTAAVNGGNSGGPLLDGRGELIGVVSAKVGGEALGLAIPVDRVRRLFAELMLDEASRGHRLGLALDLLAATAVVSAVEPGSPAARAGILAGDVLVAAGGQPLRHAVDFCLVAGDRPPAAPLALWLRRGDRTLEVSLTPEAVPLRPAEPERKLGRGVRFEIFPGAFASVVELARAAPQGWGYTATISASPAGAPAANVGLRFSGFLEVPADGAWTLYLESDDGSRLSIGDRLLVDNDGPHGALERRGSVRLARGRHPFTLLYFQGGGPKSLKLSLAGPGFPKREVPPELYWVAP